MGLLMRTPVSKALPAAMGPLKRAGSVGSPVNVLQAMSPPVVLDSFGLAQTPVRSGWEVTYGLNLPGEVCHQLGGMLDAYAVMIGNGLPVEPPPAPECMCAEDKSIYDARVKRLLETKRADAGRLQRGRKAAATMRKGVPQTKPAKSGGMDPARASILYHAAAQYHLKAALSARDKGDRHSAAVHHNIYQQHRNHVERLERQAGLRKGRATASGEGVMFKSKKISPAEAARHITDHYGGAILDGYGDSKRSALRHASVVLNGAHPGLTSEGHRKKAAFHGKLAQKYYETDAGEKHATLAAVHSHLAQGGAMKSREDHSMSHDFTSDESTPLGLASVEDYLNKADHRRVSLAQLKSGKPIYDTIGNRRHNSFTPEEHREAAAIHTKTAKHFMKLHAKHAGTDKEEHVNSIITHNLNLASDHQQMAKQKTGKSLGYGDYEGEDEMLKADHRRVPLAQTKSGKPIYDSIENRRHKHFTPGEHKEAAAIHMKAAKHFMKIHAQHAGTEKEEHVNSLISGNLKLAEGHQKMARDKAGKSLNFGACDSIDEMLKGDYRRTPIAQLKSGKPLYDGATNRRHNKFTAADHREAIGIHNKAAKHFQGMLAEHKGTDKEPEVRKLIAANKALIDGHRALAGEKSSKSQASYLCLNDGDLIVKSDMAERIESLCKSKQAGALSAR